jgi:uncharacterized membrane protein
MSMRPVSSLLRRGLAGGPDARLVRARRRWRAGLLQLLSAAAGIALGVLLPRLHAGATVPTSRAVQVLGAVGFGIVALVSIIYSLLFLVVQSSNTTFTPRLNLFQGDPWIWRTYAVATGLFTFSMSAFLAVGGAEKVSVVVPIFALGGALAVIVLVRNIGAKAFSALQVNSILESLRSKGRTVIDDLYPERAPAKAGPWPAPAAGEAGRPVVWGGPQITLQQVDLRRLLTATEDADATVIFRVRAGETLWKGATVAQVRGDLADDLVLDSLVTGVDRTFHQDPLLAFRLLADIGLRAMSAAINDPATGVQALDVIVGLLIDLAPRELAVGAIRSASGAPRISLEVPEWADFLHEGLDEFLAASISSPMMLARARRVLTLLAEQTPADRRADVESRLHQVLHAQPSLLHAQPSPSGVPPPGNDSAPPY